MPAILRFRIARVVMLLSAVGAIPLAAQIRSGDTVRIAGIRVDHRNIFDSTDHGLLPRITNSLHIPTREPFIRREFLFRAGERYDSMSAAQTARNLRALGVFAFVDIDTVRTDSGVVVGVHTRDAWTTNLDLRFRSSGGSAAYTIGALERNFLGTITQASFVFQHDPDRETYGLGFHRDRIIAGTIGGTLTLSDRSDGKAIGAVLIRPWYSTLQRIGMTAYFADSRQRILLHRTGPGPASDTLENRYVLGRLDVARAIVAQRGRYVRVGLVGQVRRDDYATEAVTALAGIPTTSVTGAIGTYIESNLRDHHTVVRGFQSFSRPEDVDLSTVVRLSLFAAPAALGYDKGNSGVAPGVGVHTGYRFRGGFGYADIGANGLYGRSGLDSGSVLASTTLALMPLPRHQLVLHAEAGALRNPVPGTEFDLGLGSGPRAFAQHSFSGDREYFLSADYRYALFPSVLKIVGVGLAAFADLGGAWYAGSGRHSGWDAGIGLRIPVLAAPEQEANRIDIAWRGARPGFPGGWVLAIGKGFAFSLGSRGTSR